MGMNRDNIQYTIDLLRSAQNFDVQTFQGSLDNRTVATTVEELHRCGNTACVAGYIALSPRWKEFGGGVDPYDGMPVTPVDKLTNDVMEDAGCDDVLAGLMMFWGLPAHIVAAIVYGNSYDVYIRDAALSTTRHWSQLTADDAADIFQNLLLKEAA